MALLTSPQKDPSSCEPGAGVKPSILLVAGCQWDRPQLIASTFAAESASREIEGRVEPVDFIGADERT